MCHCTGMQHQRHCFWNGHEISNHFRVRNGQRLSAFQLFPEQRNDGAIWTKHIPESSRNKFCIGGMLGHILNNHFTAAFCCPHDIGRVYRFIGRNHDELFALKCSCQCCQIERTDNVVFYCFFRTAFHQWHMFMGCCMKDNLRMIFFKQRNQFCMIPNRGNFHKQRNLWTIGEKQFLLNIIGVVFIDIYNDDFFGVIGHNLPDNFRPNRTATARNHTDFIL